MQTQTQARALAGRAAVAAFCIATITASPASADGTDHRAQSMLTSSMDAMGGEKLLDSLKTLGLDIREAQFRIDDSERDESPWWISMRKLSEVRDLANGRYRATAERENPQFVWTEDVISDGSVVATSVHRNGTVSWSAKPEMHDRIELAPERILLTAAHAPDLQELPDVTVHGVAHHDLRFTWRGYRVDIFIDAYTKLPDRIVSLRTNPYDLAQNAWGDVEWSTDFLFWKRELNGLVYPRQWNTDRNGDPIFIDSVISIEQNPTLAKGTFDIPDEARKQFANQGHLPFDDYPFDGEKQMTEVGKHIWLIPGNWNVMVARQEDGLVIIECPQSSGYSTKLLGFLQKQFPGVPVKAVISTTDSLWHYAGLRAYATRGIDVYALDLNVPLLRRFLAAPHTLAPDEYSHLQTKANINSVADRTAIGSGDGRIEIYPIRGQDDERMMMVYFPGAQLLYGSSNDVFSDEAGKKSGTFNLYEMVDSVQAHALKVKTYVGIHTGITPWQDVLSTAEENAVLH